MKAGIGIEVEEVEEGDCWDGRSVTGDDRESVEVSSYLFFTAV